MINYLLSFLYPVRLRNYTSRFSGNIEINLVNGVKIIDTKNSNYSYGSLQKVLKSGLKAIKFGNNFRNILVLGMGGGSVVPTIRHDFHSEAHITLVDIDEEIIAIAQNEFDLLNYSNLKLVHDDAFAFMENQHSPFDLIIMDVFIIDRVPDIFQSEDFLNLILKNLSPKGFLLYNTMNATMSDDVLQRMRNFLVPAFNEVIILEAVNGTNNLLLGKEKKLNQE